MRFTETHEWIDVKENVGVVGVSAFAQKELGDIVYVELPKVGREVKKGQEAAVLESTKAAADVYSPASGKIIEVNATLNQKPELVNTSSEGEGWLFKLQLSDPQELTGLLDKQAYQANLKDSGFSP